MDPGLALKEFLEFVVAGLVRHPESASVTHELQGKKHLYQIRLSRDDMGRMIGRNGYTISAIRSLLNAAAEKHQLKVGLRIDEAGDEGK
jgi:predicted RNA-binding protein YlqC (UPF0109 family)